MSQTRDTVLLIDDNQLNCQMLTIRLEKSGFRVVCREHGRHAADVVQELQPDLILLDILMPELDGYAVARSLKTRPRIAYIPLIAVTALAMFGDRGLALAAGCDDYISKPIDYPHLLRRIQFFLERSRALVAGTGA